MNSLREAINNNINLPNLGVIIIKVKDYLGIDVDLIESGKTMIPTKRKFILMDSYLNTQQNVQILQNKLLNQPEE